MFTNNNESMKNTETTSAINMIGAGTVIIGDIQSKGDIRVDGILKGSRNNNCIYSMEVHHVILMMFCWSD